MEHTVRLGYGPHLPPLRVCTPTDLGEYSYGGHVIDGGMPQLVEDEVFN